MVSKLLIPAAGLFVLAVLSVAMAQPTPAPAEEPEVPEWSETEQRTLRSLWIRRLGIPPHDPSNRVADDASAAELGRALFFDKRLSRNGEIACSTCHQPERYFTDGLPRAKGIGTSRRGTPTVVGAAYSPWLYWDGRRDSLWAQAVTPIENPDEMGGSRIAAARLIATDPDYNERYRSIFGNLPDLSDRKRYPDEAGPRGDRTQRKLWQRIPSHDRDRVNRVLANVGKSLAAFQRKLRPGPSRFDRYVELQLTGKVKDDPAFTDDEVAGLRVFISDGAQCLRCHNGPMFTNHGFHNIGLPAVDEKNRDFGRIAVLREVQEDPFNCFGPYSDAEREQCLELSFIKTEGEELTGGFKVPSLRNVSNTAPYMHTGQLAGLAEVLRHYRNPGNGSVGHQELIPTRFTDEQIRQLEAFLRTLESPVAAEARWLQPPMRP